MVTLSSFKSKTVLAFFSEDLLNNRGISAYKIGKIVVKAVPNSVKWALLINILKTNPVMQEGTEDEVLNIEHMEVQNVHVGEKWKALIKLRKQFGTKNRNFFKWPKLLYFKPECAQI
jgi:hypothetical protein